MFIILIVSFNLSYLDYFFCTAEWFFQTLFIMMKGLNDWLSIMFLFGKTCRKNELFWFILHLKNYVVYEKPAAMQNSGCLPNIFPHYYNFYYLIQVVILFVDHLYTFQIPQTDLMEYCVTRTTTLHLAPWMLTSVCLVVDMGKI